MTEIRRVAWPEHYEGPEWSEREFLQGIAASLGTVPLGYADMFVAVNDERRRGWFLSYSVGLWRGPIGTSRYHL